MFITSFQIKLLAAILMVIDHLGVIYELSILRIIGRFAFPLFAWLLIRGITYSRDWWRYFKRLCVFAVIAQPCFMLLPSLVFELNILCLFFLALPLIKFKNQLTSEQGVIFWSLIAIIAEFSQISYGAYGVGLIGLLACYCEFKEKHFQLWYLLWVSLSFYGMYRYGFIQGFAFLFCILLPILEPVKQQGIKARWFYWFYPLHFLPLSLLKTIH
ncbi:hypothetical protein C7H19_20020 [Aphanothece hegewaldii CCALA 016]|uniref:TraX family protein n=1 Tax=Aphanothece hegewaldii CCALA 016 TaxID=2107694 RepID=A0A2T1LT87_9CHRO|nr:TraX family protein [Aphanothece hegewaldii]PSF33459.1 hypothetical protein C7H19_20020 [Aphanothece hegewaldii CCALA 016]